MLLYSINQVSNGGGQEMINERDLDANRFSGINYEAEPESLSSRDARRIDFGIEASMNFHFTYILSTVRH